MAIDGLKTHFDLLIFGAGGHAKAVSDCAADKYPAICFISGDDSTGEWNELPIVSEDSYSYDQWRQICRKAFVAIGNSSRRAMVTAKLEEQGFDIVTLIHPSAVVSPSARLSVGVLVGPNAVINADATIGKGSIINTGVIIEHECCVGEFSHLSPGSIICGGTRIGESCWICTGATVSDHVVIGNRTIVGAGAVVLTDLPDDVLAAGIPSKIMKYLDKEN